MPFVSTGAVGDLRVVTIEHRLVCIIIIMHAEEDKKIRDSDVMLMLTLPTVQASSVVHYYEQEVGYCR